MPATAATRIDSPPPDEEFKTFTTLPDPAAGLCCPMRNANVIRGRIQKGGEGFGTPDQEMLRRRAIEIALTNGRRSDQVSETDFEQAREEFFAGQNAPANAAGEEEQEHVNSRDALLGVSPGRAARVKQATDEQTLPADLVEEGLEEAVHDQMVEGNKRSRRRDNSYDDQLPMAGA